MAPRLLLIPEFTELAGETIRPEFAAALRDFCERVLAGDAALGAGRLER